VACGQSPTAGTHLSNTTLAGEGMPNHTVHEVIEVCTLAGYENGKAKGGGRKVETGECTTR